MELSQFESDLAYRSPLYESWSWIASELVLNEKKNQWVEIRVLTKAVCKTVFSMIEIQA